MNRSKLDDALLLRDFVAGKNRAARRIVDTHLRTVTGLAHRMMQDGAEAEDVAQEAFLRLWKVAPDWRPEARIGTWLYRVTYNLCIDRLRRRKRASEGDILPTHESVIQPGANLQRKQLADIVNSAIAALPTRQRTAITLVHHLEMGNLEAAEVMDVSVKALESLLSRARVTLRQRLEGLKSDLEGNADG